MTNTSEKKDNKDFDSGYFEGKEFARRTTPRPPTRGEVEYMTEAYVERYHDNPHEVEDEDYEEAWGFLCDAYIAVFEKYQRSDGTIKKVAVVVYEGHECRFDLYAWTPGGCMIVEKGK